MEKLSKSNEQLLIKEIDQLKKKVTELEKSELKNHIWLENSPVCTKIVDLDFNLQYMSSAGVRELKIDDITKYYGKPYPLDFYPDSFKIPMTNNLRKVKETGKTIVQEAPIVDIEGNELWFQSTLVPVYKDKGELDYIMVVSLDTTDRKKAEIALAEKEAHNFAIFQNIPIATIIVDNDGKVIVGNLKQMKDDRHPAKGDIMYKDYAAKHQIDMYAEMMKIIKSGKQKVFQELKYKDKYLTISIAPFEQGAIITSQDITERKKTEETLSQQKQKLEDILEGTNAGTWNWNIQTREVKFNERWAEIMGYTLKELEPIDVNTWNNSIYPDDLPNTDALLAKHFKGELDYFDVIFRQPHKDGSLVWVNARGKVIEWTEDGKSLRMSGTNIDITDLKIAEQELAKNNANLEIIVKERTHDLEEQNKKLDSAMKVFVGREMKINELEKRIRLMGGKIE